MKRRSFVGGLFALLGLGGAVKAQERDATLSRRSMTEMFANGVISPFDLCQLEQDAAILKSGKPYFITGAMAIDGNGNVIPIEVNYQNNDSITITVL